MSQRKPHQRAASITVDPFEQLPEPADLSGQVINLGYRPCFIGPYSCIYRGKLRDSGQLVAIKVLNAVKGAALHTMRRKLERERRTWGALNHPNILPLYGFANEEDLFQPFGALISPWLDRGDAAEFLTEYGHSMTTEQRTELWKDVVAGVEYLHSYKPLLIHGDLKPRNILITDSGRAQICDFGLIRVFLDEGSSGMTTTTHHTGTERYLAYELVMAGEDARPTTCSDIHAVGCIGLEFIFSQIPYAKRKNNLGGMIFLDIRAKKPPAKHPPRLSSDLELLWMGLERCWETSPEDRPSAGTLLAWLEEQMASQMLEQVSDVTVVQEQPGGLIQGKGEDFEERQPHRRYSEGEVAQLYRQHCEGIHAPEEDVDVIPTVHNWPDKIEAIEGVQSKGASTPSLVEEIHARIRTHSQTSQSTSLSSSSGYLPSIHSRLSNDPEVASVRSIPGDSASRKMRSGIPLFDENIASPEMLPGSLPAYPSKSQDGLQGSSGVLQGKRDSGYAAGVREHEQKGGARGDTANSSQLMGQRSGRSSGYSSWEAEKIEIPKSVGAEEPLRVAILWYLHVHARNERFRWIKCNSILFPSHLQLMWVEAGGGKAIVRLDLLSCQEVRGIPSPSHASAWKDIGNVTARAQALDDAGGVAGIDELCPFQMIYEDGVERLGAGSPLERSRWMEAIWDTLNRAPVISRSSSFSSGSNIST